jgi:hypothetical protein
MAIRRRACESAESIDDWAAEHRNNSRGIRERHMERTVAQVFPAQKTFLTRWTCRLTNRNGRGASCQNGFEINLCIVSL